MGKRLKRLLSFVIMSTILVGSAQVVMAKDDLKRQEDIKKVIDDINSRNKRYVRKQTNDMNKYANWYNLEEFQKDFTEKEFTQAVKQPEFNNKVFDITYAEAKEDVDFLFKLFRYNYAPYQYFGGDIAFNAAKAKILKQIEGKEKISNEELQSILLENLKFIRDLHFSIQRKTVYRTFFLNYIYNEAEFYKDETGYYKLVSNDKYYIKSLNGDSDIDSVMKLTINKEGKLVYSIGIVEGIQNFKQNTNYSLIKEIVYFKGCESIRENITLQYKSEFVKKGTDKLYNVTENKGIPVLEIFRTSMALDFDKAMGEIAKVGKEFKDKQAIIIDLRGNSGGTVNLFFSWLDEYYKDADLEDQAFSLVTPIDKARYSYYADRKDLFKVSNNSGKDLLKNNNKIFILTDKRTASAAEITTRYLKQFENVVVVGTNTSGAILGGNLSFYGLMNSKIYLGFSGMLALSAPKGNLDGEGYEPDIWVDGDNSLESVVKLIENYKLNEKK